MNPIFREVTLQINVCAADIGYCDLTVRALVKTHRRQVLEVLVVMDCCRPQSTPFVHQPSRFPDGSFTDRLTQLDRIVERWLSDGVVDRVVRLKNNPDQLGRLNEKYSGVSARASHDNLGHASAAYYLGWEECKTRYALHLDGDILFHQSIGQNWVSQAVAALQADPKRLAVSPRISPPMANSKGDTLVDLKQIPHCGWASTWPLEPIPEGWSSPWFSTRCHLLDRTRLAARLPLTPTRGQRAYARGEFWNRVLAPLFNLRMWTTPIPPEGWLNLALRAVRKVGFKIPEFPLPPEVLVHENNQRHQIEVIYLNDHGAWFVHPASKPDIFLRLLPEILRFVERGEFPNAQGGMCDLDFSAWEAWLAART